MAIELNLGNDQLRPGAVGLEPQNTPLVADLTGDGVPDVTIVNGAVPSSSVKAIPVSPVDSTRLFHPSIPATPRDITSFDTPAGVVLASVDATDNFITLYKYDNNKFTQLGNKLPTGARRCRSSRRTSCGACSGGPQCGRRHADHLSERRPGRVPASARGPVGLGVSDVAVANVNPYGFPDLIVANQVAGTVEGLLNNGTGGFDPPSPHRAGVGRAPGSEWGRRDGPACPGEPGRDQGRGRSLHSGRSSRSRGAQHGLERSRGVDGTWGRGVCEPDLRPDSRASLGGPRRRPEWRRNSRPVLLGPTGVTIELGNGRGGFTSMGPFNVGWI